MDARIEVPQNIEKLSMAELEALDEVELEAYLLKVENEIQEAEAYSKKMQEESDQRQAYLASLKERTKQLGVEIEITEIEANSYGKTIQQLEKKINENEVKNTSLDKKLEGLRQERHEIIDKAFAPIDKEKKYSNKDTLLPSSGSFIPPSKASSEDNVSRNLSNLSLSRSSKDSASSEEKEKIKSSAKSLKSSLSSSAVVGSLFPPATITQSRSSSKADFKEPSDQRPQTMAVTLSKASIPQKNNGLLAKLGFNKPRLTSQSSLPPITGSCAGVAVQKSSLSR
jgi:hypothetical protein